MPASRVLTHPHVDEQPFTRSQSGNGILAGTNQVREGAHGLLHGYSGREVVVDLTASEGPGFVVIR